MVILVEDVIEAAEDGEDVHHELVDVRALIPPLSWKVML